MTYRNGTYVAFHAGGTSDPTASDIRYYNALRMWDANNKIDFRFVNSHEKTYAVRDTSSKETLRNRLVERLSNSKHMLLIVTGNTRKDTDWVPFEISHAVDVCKIPIIAAYPGYDVILAPALLRTLWPSALEDRIDAQKARVIHIPFKKSPIMDAIGQFDFSNMNYPKDGLGFYNRDAHVAFGLLSL